jgi:hypothetical protein
MAWTSPPTVVAKDLVTASLWNTSVRDNLNVCAVALATASGRMFCATAANAMAQRTPDRALVATGQTRTLTTYGDLTTVGPAVTGTTGVRALASWGAIMSNSTAGLGARMACDISGATTSAADDTNSAACESGNANDGFQISWTTIFNPITAGSSTFTAKYRAIGGGTASFTTRIMTLIPF